MRFRRAHLSLLLALQVITPATATELTIGSKAFTESVILGEIAMRAIEQAEPNAEVSHRAELGGSRILFEALKRGDIDAYPEYTGTLRYELLQGLIGPTGALDDALSPLGITTTEPLGFNNTYALGMAEERAEALGIRTISDLIAHPDLEIGFSNEFMERADGWPALRERYGLPHRRVNGMSHELGYRAVDAGQIDVIDLYSTDPQIAQYGLRALTDDLMFFPRYDAVFLYRSDLTERSPGAVTALEALAGALDEPTMITLNGRAQLGGVSESAVAAGFLGGEETAEADSRWVRIWRRTVEHLLLVGLSLGAAIVVAIPLGVAAARRPALGQLVLGATGVLQTVPSLAMFVFLIPFLGIGAAPAIVALFVYSLLPIVRNTHTGLIGIPTELQDVSRALNLPTRLRLFRIELPLAAGSILAGIKTAAVINVGTATLGALIGAGGYGQPILTGIRLDDMGLILEGAIPAALLALATQALFDLAERRLAAR